MSTSFSKSIFTRRFFNCTPQINLILLHLEDGNKNKDEREGSKKEDCCKMTVWESNEENSFEMWFGVFFCLPGDRHL